MKVLKIMTIIFNMLIIVGAGHATVPLGLFELIGPLEFLSGSHSGNNYHDKLVNISPFTLIGQISLICSFFFKEKTKSLLTLIGCSILLYCTYILVKDLTGYESITLITSIPFFVTSLILLIKEFINSTIN